jgi:hypothetical protein
MHSLRSCRLFSAEELVVLIGVLQKRIHNVVVKALLASS